MHKPILLAALCALGLALPVTAQSGFGGFYQSLTQEHTLRSPADLYLNDTAPGQIVGETFDVNGVTSPGNQVEVSVSPSHTNVVIFSHSLNADSQGRFGVRVDASQANYNSLLTVRVHALDAMGNEGPTRSYEVLRR